MQEPTDFPTPPERPLLEPFASLLLQVVMPKALAAQNQGTATAEELTEISRRIEVEIVSDVGHGIHPAIWVHALLVCVHYYYEAAEAVEGSSGHLPGALDAAFSLLKQLELHHDLYDLYLLIS